MPSAHPLARRLPLALSLALVPALAAVATPAFAQSEVFVTGYTNGAFNGVPPNTSATQTATLGGLTYVNAVFSATTAAGFRGFGAAPVAPPTQNFNNLGAFSLGTAPFTYTGNTFALRTTFTAPEGIAVTNTALFIATLTGTVTSNPSTGRVTLDFDNTPRLFTFADANCQGTTLPGQQTTCGTGSFSFAVNDLEIDVGQVVALTGQITGAQQSLSTIPEPGTWALLGTGLLALGGVARRKRVG